MALEAIGSGFGRAGTKSLPAALERLGYGRCHHMHEVVENPEQVLHWQKLAAGEAVDWTTVFAGYKSQVDWPGAHVWRELASAFPNAKSVHTVRPEENWNTPYPRLSRPVAAPRAKDGIVRSCGHDRSASP
ncbi:MAG: hypothetical protein F9K34_08830 [Albidovulum sp.]|uniref:sulfotransferase family protein n=1 Tax=Albidovulum sp. TaxID=1872424 RepID=UPI00132C27EB|nr:sulfotransferase family protein [Defluviimonas sp.]KAB2884414.1 MAG: hypothetical protein F9K34_08830 [Defluviimonas sp.]